MELYRKLASRKQVGSAPTFVWALPLPYFNNRLPKQSPSRSPSPHSSPLSNEPGGIAELHQGVSDKRNMLQKIAATYDASPEEIAYIGDDLNDLPCIRYCGIAACPADAVSQVLENVDYVCKHHGGRGAVREYIEWLVQAAGKDRVSSSQQSGGSIQALN